MSDLPSITPRSAAGEAVRPEPPRFRKLKRGVAALLLLAALLGGARWWWGYEAQRRLDKLIADAHARGEPILLEDFTQHGNDDPDNAAVPLTQALNSFSFTAAESRLDLGVDPFDSSLSNQKVDAIAAMIRNHRGELQLVREARSRRDACWEFKPEMRVRYSSEGALARLLVWSARFEHSHGNEREALEDLRDLFAFTRAMDARAPWITNHRIVLVLESWGCREVRMIASAPEGFRTPSSSGAGPEREQVAALIGAMLDDQMLEERMVLALWGWRAGRLYNLRDGQYTSGCFLCTSPVGLRPLIAFDELRHMPELSQEIAGVKLSSWPCATSRRDTEELNEEDSGVERLLPYVLFLPDVGARTVLHEHFREIADRRIAATALALAMFRADHDNRLPETLRELVPKYLAAVPADPFRPDPGPIGYLSHRSPPALYSVGESAIDKGALTKGTELVDLAGIGARLPLSK